MRTTYIVSITVALVVGGGVWAYRSSHAPTPLDPFAACLKDKGTVMYGAYWCPHCADQKKLFGRSFRKAAYVECAMPGNPQAQTPQCREKNIAGYPTWIFGDDTRQVAVLPLAELAKKTGCELPTP